MLRHPCILQGPQRQARGLKSSKLIHGQFHIGDGPQRHHLWGKEAQKGKNSNKNRGERVYRGIRYTKIACVHVPLYCLYSRIITQTARRRISTPGVPVVGFRMFVDGHGCAPDVCRSFLCILNACHLIPVVFGCMLCKASAF